MAKDKAQNKGKGQQQQGKQSKKGGSKKAPVEFKKYKRETPPRLRSLYEQDVKQKLMDEFGYKNVMQVPRLVKITLNMGLGRAVQDPKLIESAAEELRQISGQAPVVAAAKKDIATFKLRKGHKIGAFVTLRRAYMWEFLDRFVSVALPRVRDFRGVSAKAFDGRGNFSCGIKEQIIFPEIDYDKIDAVKGLNVTVVTTAQSDAEGRALLRHLGMPFRGASGTREGAQA